MAAGPLCALLQYLSINGSSVSHTAEHTMLGDLNVTCSQIWMRTYIDCLCLCVIMVLAQHIPAHIPQYTEKQKMLVQDL